MISIMLAGWCAAAVSALFRGPEPEFLVLVPMSLGLGLSRKDNLFTPGLLLVMLSLASPGMIAWAAITAGVLWSLAGRNLTLRATGFATAASAAWFVPVQGTLPLLVVSAAAAASGMKAKPLLVIGVAAALVSSVLIGLPAHVSPEPAYLRLVTREDELSSETAHLYTGSGELMVPAPVSGRWAMWVAIETGGLRDTLPAVAVCLREDMLILPAGKDTLCFEMVPGDTLSVSLLRGCRPFSHPVVHVEVGGARI